MEKGDFKFVKIMTRYLLLLIIAIPGLKLFYNIFLPLTKYPVHWALGLSYDVIMTTDTLFVQDKIIEIIGACVAGSAYYFLLILNLITPGIKTMKRIKLLLFTFGTFFLINITRIYVLSIMYIEGNSYFELAHKLFWYLGSTLFIVIIWFVGAWLFDVQKIPFVDDLKILYAESSLKKKSLR